MRRFIAYILASTTILLSVGVAFKPIATKINADLNYRDSKAITFKLTDSDGKTAPKDEEAAENYAATMDDRLKAYGADDYKIVVKGNDTVVVTLTANNDTEYTNISKMLTVSPKIVLATVKEDNDVEVNEDGWSWHDGKAYIAFDGSTSIVVMPIPEKAREKVKALYEKAKKNEEEKKTNDEPKEVTPSIALWFNRFEGETYDKIKTYKNIGDKMIHEFKSADFYYGTNQDAFQIKFAPTSSDKTAIENSYHMARCYQTMLNSSTHDYVCTAIHEERVSAGVENLLIYGDHISINTRSASFIALIIAFILISLILTMFYRLGSIAVISSMSAHTFLTFMVFVLLRPLFNVAAYVGIIIVSLASLFIGVAYNAYLHEECYKGRNLKKANFEASKKTTMLAVDTSILFLIVGIMMYFIGGASIASLGVMLIIGSFLNIIINTFILKGLMWLLTNATFFQNRLNFLNIKQSKVPNLAKEEKPSYFGPFQNKQPSLKQKKITGAILASLLLASAIGMTVFGVTNKTMFNAGNYYATTNEIHFKLEDSSLSKTDPLVNLDDFKTKVLDNIKKNNEKLKYTNVTAYSYTTDVCKYVGQEPTIKMKVFNYTVTLDDDGANKLNVYSYKDSAQASLEETFNLALKNEYSEVFANPSCEIKASATYNFTSNETMIFLASVASIAIMGIYFWIRYRASRALTISLVALAASIFTMGYFTLFRFSATPIMAIAVSMSIVIATMMGLYILNKDKDLIRDERIRDVNTRKEVLKKALMFGLAPMSIFVCLAAVLGITYFGFSSRVYASMYMSAAFAALLSFIVYYSTFNDMANFFDERFMRVKLPKIQLKKKKKIVNKSNEPTEAIFFGIND